MEIIGDTAHRMLAYVEAVNRQGYHLTVKEFEAYASGWEPSVTTVGTGSEFGYTLANIQRVAAFALYGDARRETESMIDYLCRLMWLSRRAGRVEITPLGKAVLREANTPVPDSDAGSTVEVILDPTNPFAYAQLMAKISELEGCLIVDPYLDQEQLLVIATIQNVTRVLTGNKGLKAKGPVFGLLLDAAPHLEIRTLEQGKLHDRYALPESGSAHVLGSSLNSIARRFGVVTTLEPDSSKLIIDHYNELWSESVPIDRVKTRKPAKEGLSLEGHAVSGAAGEGTQLPGDDLGDK
jgi:hypothetical protein